MASCYEIIQKAIQFERGYKQAGFTITFENGKDKIIRFENDEGKIAFNLTKRIFTDVTITDSRHNGGNTFLRALQDSGYIPKMRLGCGYACYGVSLSYVLDMDKVFKDIKFWHTISIPYFENELNAWFDEHMGKMLKDVCNAEDDTATFRSINCGFRLTTNGKSRKYIDAFMDALKQYLSGIDAKWIDDKTYEVKIDGRGLKIYNRPESRGVDKGGKQAFTLV